MNSMFVIENHHGQIVAQYRKHLKWSQLDLAEELGVDLRTVQRMEKMSVIKNEKRRELLVGLLGIPAAMLDLAPATHVAPPSILPVNPDQMAFCETVVETKWQTYYLGGPLAAAQGFDLYLQEIKNFATTARGTAWQERALSLLCQSYLLQGDIRGHRDPAKAQAALQTAYKIAQEMEDRRWMAAVLTDQGIMLQHQGKLSEAVAYEERALKLINGSGFVRLREYILKTLAFTHAKLGRKSESQRALELAEHTFYQQEDAPSKGYFESTAGSIQAYRGDVALEFGEYDRALSLIEKSLSICDPTNTPQRAWLVTQQAQVHYKLGNVEESIFDAEQGLKMARSIGSAKGVGRIAQLHADLASSQWKGERGVARLRALLAMR